MYMYIHMYVTCTVGVDTTRYHIWLQKLLLSSIFDVETTFFFLLKWLTHPHSLTHSLTHDAEYESCHIHVLQTLGTWTARCHIWTGLYTNHTQWLKQPHTNTRVNLATHVYTQRRVPTLETLSNYPFARSSIIYMYNQFTVRIDVCIHVHIMPIVNEQCPVRVGMPSFVCKYMH